MEPKRRPGRPRRPDKPAMKSLTVRLPVEVYDALYRIVEARQMSWREFFAEIVKAVKIGETDKEG